LWKGDRRAGALEKSVQEAGTGGGSSLRGRDRGEMGATATATLRNVWQSKKRKEAEANKLWQ